jgi:hypothetical protein
MTEQKDNFLAYVKYQGDLIEDGYLDTRKSAEALLGIDEVIRYFLYQVDKDLQKVEFEIPVRIRKGSWEALIPHDVLGWLLTAGGAGVTAYATTALNKMAEHDFKDKGLKDVFKKVVKSIKWVIKIATHLKSLAVKEFLNVEFKQENAETLIGIKNDKGEILYVPKSYLEIYKNCPDKLFVRLTKIIEKGRELEIGFNPNEVLDKDDTTPSVKIDINDKSVFVKENNEDEILFPELIHDQYVELYGHVSRGNENSNTIGFEYQGHVLTCLPRQGNIKEYKDRMFTNSIIKGYVDRLGDDGNINEKRPRISFIDLIEKPKDNNKQAELFST